MPHENTHRSKITKTTHEYGTDATRPLLSAMSRLIVLSRLMSIQALEGQGVTEAEVMTLVYLIDEVGKCVEVFDPEAYDANLPF